MRQGGNQASRHAAAACLLAEVLHDEARGLHRVPQVSGYVGDLEERGFGAEKRCCDTAVRKYACLMLDAVSATKKREASVQTAEAAIPQYVSKARPTTQQQQ